MPLFKIYLPNTLASNQVSEISKSIHDVATQTFNVTNDDIFHIVHQIDPKHMLITKKYKGIDHNQELWCLLQVICNENRSIEMKNNFYQQVSKAIESCSEIKASDVIINIIDVNAANWSFGLN